MRTTLDIPGPLLRRARKLACDRKIPFHALVTEALRRVIDEEPARRNFKLPDRSSGTGGLVAGLSWTDWGTIRDVAGRDVGG